HDRRDAASRHHRDNVREQRLAAAHLWCAESKHGRSSEGSPNERRQNRCDGSGGVRLLNEWEATERVTQPFEGVVRVVYRWVLRDRCKDGVSRIEEEAHCWVVARCGENAPVGPHGGSLDHADESRDLPRALAGVVA